MTKRTITRGDGTKEVQVYAGNKPDFSDDIWTTERELAPGEMLLDDTRLVEGDIAVTPHKGGILLEIGSIRHGLPLATAVALATNLKKVIDDAAKKPGRNGG